MPIEENGDSVGGEPEPQPLIQPPIEPPANQNPPSNPTNNHPEDDKNNAANLQNVIRTAERWVIGIGIASILINSIIAYIYWAQLHQMRIATEATTQAVQLTSEALYSSNGPGGQVDRTMHQMIDQTVIQSESSIATQKAANAAESAADTARYALVVSERPWLKVDVQMDAPITFDAGGSATIQVTLTATNIGHSIAKFVAFDPGIAVAIDDATEFNDAAARQKIECDRFRQETPPWRTASDVIFPGDTASMVYSVRVPVPKVDMSRAIAPTSSANEHILHPSIYGCVNYQFPLVPSEAKVNHQTRFLFSISGVNAGPSGPIWAPIIIGVTTPVERLVVRRTPFMGSDAD